LTCTLIYVEYLDAVCCYGPCSRPSQLLLRVLQRCIVQFSRHL
jgi:hypothetical protein